MTKSTLYRFIALSIASCQLLLFSCTNRNSPNLSEARLLALMNEISQKAAETPAFVLPDSDYVPSAGIEYAEIRAIDQSAPPVIIDIVGNLNNRKEFKLSDIASSVKYVLLQSPPDATITLIRTVVSDDERIFIHAREGLFCYSADGQYLYTVVANVQEIVQLGSESVPLGSWGSATRLISGITFTNVDLLDGRLIFRSSSLEEGVTDVRLNVFDVKELDAQMRFITQPGELRNFSPQPLYQRKLDPTKDTGLSSRYMLIDDR